MRSDAEAEAGETMHAEDNAQVGVTTGIEVDEEETDYLKIAEDVLALFSAIFVPGKYLVETFPILRFLPEWMPGAQFKRDGKVWTKVVNKLVTIPWKVTGVRLVRTCLCWKGL